MLYYMIDLLLAFWLANKIFYIKKSCDLRGVYIIWYHQSCRSMKFRLSYCLRRWLKPDVINKRSKYDRIPLNLICLYQFVMESCNKTTINCWGGGGSINTMYAVATLKYTYTSPSPEGEENEGTILGSLN